MEYQVIIDKTIYIDKSNIEKVCININSKREHTTSTNLILVVRNLRKEDIGSLIATESKEDKNNLITLKPKEVIIVKHYPNGDRMVYQFTLAIVTDYYEEYGRYCNVDIRSRISFEQYSKKLEIYFVPKNFNLNQSKALEDIMDRIEKANKNNNNITIGKTEEMEEIEHIDNSVKGEKRRLKAKIVDYETDKEVELENITTYSITYTENNVVIILIGVLPDKTPDIMKKLKTKNLNEGFFMGLTVGKFTTEIERKQMKQRYEQRASSNSGAIKINIDSFGVNVIKYDEKYNQEEGVNFFCMTVEKK